MDYDYEYTPMPWSRPVARPKPVKGCSSVCLTEVKPLPEFALKAYARYTAKKEEFATKKAAEKAAMDALQAEMDALSKKATAYRVPQKGKTQNEYLLEAKGTAMAKHISNLSSLAHSYDKFLQENKALEEVMYLQKKMEEAYGPAKLLQEASRASWAALF
jgi:hypothetical protein